MFADCCGHATIVAHRQPFSAPRNMRRRLVQLERASKDRSSVTRSSSWCRSGTTERRSIAFSPGRLRHLISDESTATANFGQRANRDLSAHCLRYARAGAQGRSESRSRRRCGEWACAAGRAAPGAVGLRIHVGGGQHDHDLFAFLTLTPPSSMSLPRSAAW